MVPAPGIKPDIQNLDQKLLPSWYQIIIPVPDLGTRIWFRTWLRFPDLIPRLDPPSINMQVNQLKLVVTQTRSACIPPYGLPMHPEIKYKGTLAATWRRRR